MKNNVWTYNLLIAIAALMLFIPFLGAVHLFDWDEINFAECAREMLASGDYFSVKINYRPFWEKPPIFIWLQALSMNVFGVNEFAARLPNAICGCITLLVLFNIGRKLVDNQFGLVWVMVYAASFLPHFYFKSGIIDPWFNLFIFLGIYYFILTTNQASQNNNRTVLLSALFIGLAILTKGPAALLIFGLCYLVFMAIKRFRNTLPLKQLILFGVSVAVVGSLWFLLLILTGNAAIIKEFFLYQVRLFNTQDAGHGGPFFYHWIVLLIGCFPLSIFAISALKRSAYDTPFQKHFKLWMHIMFWVVLILFSIVKTKIVHYSSLCYFPLSFMGAYAVYKLMNEEFQWKKITGILLITVASIIGIAISALPLIDRFKTEIINANLIKDVFAVESLKAQVSWTGWEPIIGLAFILGTIIMVILMNRKKMMLGLVGIFAVSLITINSTMVLIVPRIEPYSQGAAIEFYEYLKDKNCYVETLGFKSYAHLFYSQKPQPQQLVTDEVDWLLKGEIDKPAYFVSKINQANEIQQSYPQLKELYRKNGFVFFMRK
jgi:4-amino-4-deoxy-L-arabinose transferase-like glycosyltransferase